MLWVFSLSITPQTYLHDLFAGHTDSLVWLAPGEKDVVNKSGLDCHFNDLVATSPFLDLREEILIQPLIASGPLPTPFLVGAAFDQPFYWEGRGPPSLG